MASEVEICNMALRHLGAVRIASLDEARQEAKDCKLFYPVSRDAVLIDHPWNFAQKRRALALMDTPTDYAGAYSLAYIVPADCLRARKVVLPSGDDTAQEFSVVRAPTGEKIILTNAVDAVLVYTLSATDPTWFDAQFIEALALKLASKLARPLLKSPQAEQAFATLYVNYVNAAKASDANEGDPETVPEIDWIQARLGLQGVR
jgi:hypothetical protein